MVKTIKLSIDTPRIPAGSTLVHTSTSWEVSKLPDFSNVDNLILQSLEDTENLTEYRMVYDMGKNEPLYFRTRLHFNNGKSSNWSKIVPLNPDQIGIKLSSTIVITPVIKVDISYENNINGELHISTADMRLFGGIGNHISTTWVLIDSDGKELFRRDKDRDNKTSIILEAELLEKDKFYIIKAKHHTNTNAESNYGQAIINTYTGKASLFELYTHYPLVPNRYIYFELRLFTTRFRSIDIRIMDEYDRVVSEIFDQTSKIPRIFTGDLKPYTRYTIQARLRLVNGETTEWKNILTSMIRPNLLINYKDNIEYLNKQSYVQEMILNGMTVQSSHELYSGNILFGKYNDNNVYSYKFANDRLIEVESAFTLDGMEDNISKPYYNFIPLHNGRVVVDYGSDIIDSDTKHPTFKVFEYNPLTHKFIYLHSLTRDDELMSTSVSASAAVLQNNIIYYIPAIQLDNDEIKNLNLRRYDTINNVMLDDIPLPINIKRHVNLIVTDDNNLILFGGSNDKINDVTTENPLDNIDLYQRDNNDIYHFNTTTEVWTKIGTFPDSIPVSLYNFQSYLRRDKKIVLFNAVNSGPSLGNQSTYVYDYINNTFQIDDNDFGDNLSYRNSIVLQNGDILRISTRLFDPQKMYKYISDTMSEEDVIDNLVIDSINDLVVPAGETVTIETPYRYNSITIEGTSYDDTGVLRWIDGDTVHTFRYKDLIITRDLTITQNHFEDITEWDSITILDDAKLIIYNVIFVPDNESFQIEGPLVLDEIRVGDNSELIIEVDEE